MGHTDTHGRHGGQRRRLVFMVIVVGFISGIVVVDVEVILIILWWQFRFRTSVVVISYWSYNMMN